MRRFSQRNSLVTLNDINITPLLDLAFVLLIIFVITTPLLEKGLDLKLPPANGRPDKQVTKEDVRTVEISNTGAYYFDKQTLKVDQIVTRLEADFNRNPNIVVYIRADRKSPMEYFVTLTDALQSRGITRYSILYATIAESMNRTQKKCIIVSAGLHLLLALLLLIGPGFLPSSNGPVVKPIEFGPVKVVEGAISGGGNPNANPPPPAPPEPAPPEVVTPPVQQQQVQSAKPQDAPKPPPPIKTVEKAVPTPVVKPAKPLPQVSTVIVTGKPTNKPPTKPTSNSQDADKKRAADQVGRAIAGLKNNLAPTTSFELRGIGGGGETYAGVQQTVLSTYDRVWSSPEGMDASEATVDVSVTIESDGTVSSARITKPSGDPRVDKSVQKALDRVSTIPGWDGKRRTVEFTFKSRAKENV